MRQKSLRRAVYPGSFDPITCGHVDIVRRFAPLFEELTVLAASSIHKGCWFSLEERAEMAREALRGIANVRVDSLKGLTAEYLREKGIFAVLRGIRSVSDFPYERDLAINNKKIFSEMETFLVFSQTGMEIISAKWIKEIASCGGNLKGLVPPCVQSRIEKKAREAF